MHNYAPRNKGYILVRLGGLRFYQEPFAYEDPFFEERVHIKDFFLIFEFFHQGFVKNSLHHNIT